MGNVVQFKPKSTQEKIQESGQKKATMGTLYDMNLYFYEQLPSMDSKKFDQMTQNIGMWFSSESDNKYFMLLCRELFDFTVLHFEHPNYVLGKEELIMLIHCRAKEVKDIVYNHDTNTYDIWLVSSLDGKVHMYKLFMCNDFIIEI